MSREFRIEKTVELDATPDQVWDAIATGPGISSWFMGPHQVEPGVGGSITLTVGEFHSRATITAWEPGRHLAYRAGPDSGSHAFEYVIEGRAGGRAVLRFAHSGFASDDWGQEYIDQTTHGWTMYLHTLDLYLRHFRGRPGTYVYAESPKATGGQDAWALVTRGLGLSGPVAEGDRVRLTPAGIPAIEGVVDTVPAAPAMILGVRAAGGMYRFHGHGDNVGVGHHLFGSGVDAAVESERWSGWLARAFAG